MKTRDIERFFEELNRQLKTPVQILLTGGAAGVLQGINRATYDVDFEAHIKHRAEWEAFQTAVEETARRTGITPEYAEDIDRWSSIALPARTSRLYRRIGKVEVRLLNPGLWAVGKLARYLSSDIHDLRKVLRSTKTRGPAMARLWGKALGMSSPSSAQGNFRRQVEAFFDEYAQEIWGRKTDPAKLKHFFLESARRAQAAQT